MRNLKSEAEWKKKKYERILADIDKELGVKLKQKLLEEKKSVASWITENAKKYLKED